jgi:CRP-like cAMP-binding protein
MLSHSDLLQYKQIFKAGELLCKQGNPADVFYILVEGIIGVYCDDQLINHVNDPGAYVGEMAALLGQPRNASLKAETPLSVYALPVTVLPKLLKTNPDIANKLMSTLARRLDDADQRLVKLSQRVSELEQAVRAARTSAKVR